MASIPCSPRHSSLSVYDGPSPSFKSPSTTPSLQYFNMRVTERLHRYRSLTRQWYEVAKSGQSDPNGTPISDSPLLSLDVLALPREPKETVLSTVVKENTSVELNPIRSQIQRDLMHIRKLIKARQKKIAENLLSKSKTMNKSSGEVSSIDDHENNHMATSRKLSSKNITKAAAVASSVRPSTYPHSNIDGNGHVVPDKSSSTCSQYSKQSKVKQQLSQSKTFNIYRSRINPPLSTDSLVHGVTLPKKTPYIPPKLTLKQTQSYHLPIPGLRKKKPATFNKQPSVLPPIRRPSHSEQVTTCLYTYAASTSSTIPPAKKLNRNASLLPILFTSTSFIGIPTNRAQFNKTEDNDDDYQDFLNYKQVLSHLPKPLITTAQDENGVLFDRLDHIRETMPVCNVYDAYTRVC